MTAPIVLVPGAAKKDPFTIALIANPVLIAKNSGQLRADPIMSNRPAFDKTTAYIVAVLHGALPGQREAFLSEPSVAGQARIIALFPDDVSMANENALVMEEPGESDLLVPRRNTITKFLSRAHFAADVVYAISDSDAMNRASAYPATDDDTRPGVGYTLDDADEVHRFWAIIPGTIALHTSATSLTALHEFGHAVVSYAQGSAQIVDLYVDSDPAVNCKRARPIPAAFATYQGTSYQADTTRDSIGYEPGWTSYHCDRQAGDSPAVMDNYWEGRPPEGCEHDKITREFLLDRIRAKMSR